MIGYELGVACRDGPHTTLFEPAFGKEYAPARNPESERRRSLMQVCFWRCRA